MLRRFFQMGLLPAHAHALEPLFAQEQDATARKMLGTFGLVICVNVLLLSFEYLSFSGPSLYWKLDIVLFVIGGYMASLRLRGMRWLPMGPATLLASTSLAGVFALQGYVKGDPVGFLFVSPAIGAFILFLPLPLGWVCLAQISLSAVFVTYSYAVLPALFKDYNFFIIFAMAVVWSMTFVFHSTLNRQRRESFLNHHRAESLNLELEEQLARLAQVNASLVETNSDLDAFAGMVAHDLKNPLNVIALASGSLRDELSDDVPEPQHPELLMLERAVNKAQTIIDELLVMARVRREEEVSEPLDMAAIVSQALSRLELERSRLEASVEAQAQWPEVLGYAPWIEEVWVNYISNGLKYGGRPPLLRLGARKEEDGQVRFWLQDNGKGIEHARREELFLEFSRLGRAGEDGHGLGLSIVLRIVTKLGGRVGMEPNEETEGPFVGGSTFFFTLPTSGVQEAIR